MHTWVLLAAFLTSVGALAIKALLKQQALKRSWRLLEQARRLIFLWIAVELGIASAASEAERNLIARKAGARANSFFGEPHPAEHSQGIDPSAEAAHAVQMLERNSALGELVVQTVRMMHFTYFAENHQQINVGDEILAAFGAKYRTAPTVDSFSNLLVRVDRQLQPVLATINMPA